MQVQQLLAILQENEPDVYAQLTSNASADATKIRAQASRNGISGTTVQYILKQIVEGYQTSHVPVPPTAFVSFDTPAMLPVMQQAPGPIEAAAEPVKPDQDLAQAFLEQCQMNYVSAEQAEQHAEQAITCVKDVVQFGNSWNLEGIAHSDDEDIASILNQLQCAAVDAKPTRLAD